MMLHFEIEGSFVMQELKPLEIKIERIAFDNNIVIPNATEPVDIQIGTNISSVVNYDEENGRCKCVTTVLITPQNMQVDFKVEMCVAGIFDYEKGSDHKEVHIAACKKLFPHVQSRVMSFMSLVGIPNFMLEEPILSPDVVCQDTL